jgi:hypothetical protein
MSQKFELMHHAINIAETAKDAMRTDSVGEPDDATWEIAVNVLKQAQQLLPGNAIVHDLKLTSKLWVSIRSAMDAVANALSAANTSDSNATVANRNRRVLDSIRNGY